MPTITCLAYLYSTSGNMQSPYIPWPLQSFEELQQILLLFIVFCRSRERWDNETHRLWQHLCDISKSLSPKMTDLSYTWEARYMSTCTLSFLLFPVKGSLAFTTPYSWALGPLLVVAPSHNSQPWLMWQCFSIFWIIPEHHVSHTWAVIAIKNNLLAMYLTYL